MLYKRTGEFVMWVLFTPCEADSGIFLSTKMLFTTMLNKLYIFMFYGILT